MFTQRAKQLPLATTILVYPPKVPSFDCHDNKLVVMPNFQLQCVVSVAALCTPHLLLPSLLCQA